MKASKALEFLRLIVAGGIVGTAVAGAFFGGLSITVLGLDLNEAGAVIGALSSAILVKAIHLV